MTDGIDQALRNAGIALLQADANLTVIPGAIPAGQQPPYVRVYSSVEWLADDPNDSLDNVSSRAVVRWWCHCVGGNDLAAIGVAELVRTDLLNVRPTVVGVNPSGVGMIRHEQDQPPTVDETLGPAVVDAVHIYRLTVDT
jgi:hypothetical protein